MGKNWGWEEKLSDTETGCARVVKSRAKARNRNSEHERGKVWTKTLLQLKKVTCLRSLSTYKSHLLFNSVHTFKSSTFGRSQRCFWRRRQRRRWCCCWLLHGVLFWGWRSSEGRGRKQMACRWYRMLCGTKQIIKDVNDGGEWSLRFSTHILQGRIDSS